MSPDPAAEDGTQRDWPHAIIIRVSGFESLLRHGFIKRKASKNRSRTAGKMLRVAREVFLENAQQSQLLTPVTGTW
jgi:hypothetical protein